MKSILTWVCVLAIFFMMNNMGSCVAETYTAKTGPFTINVTSNESVDFNTDYLPVALENYNSYEVHFDVGGDSFQLTIEDYGRPMDVSTDALLKRLYDFDWNLANQNMTWSGIDIGGKPGNIGLRVDAKAPWWDFVYSPDGFGNRGTVIVMGMIFYAGENKVENVLKTLKIRRTD